ncbi:multiple cyclophane-containing RiPP AmcA [Kitasatospora sp. NPDC056651]|uniref:multiple cyclophane-containing RiPP AmcA n=1 Tax=Kitasatospora sp. NPDC056651 TaxID=3345892 RepID=UPI0036C5CAAC
MPVAIAEAVARSVAEFADTSSPEPVEVVWHAGEPLAVGRTLATSNTAVVADLTGLTVTGPIAGPFDNRPTWDNNGPKFDNRPTWDNWSNKNKGK